MVSFWPWKADSSSPASFEKTLSTLATKIADAQARLDRLRTNSRRVKVLWTLYLGFAYLVYAIVLLLVVGYQNLGLYEWGGMAGGPLLIYATRALITAYFTYHIDTTNTRLKSHSEERAKTIQKLKDATKYESTLELIEKYGGEKPKPKKDDKSPHKPQTPKKNALPTRTNLPPPPTANIQRPEAQNSAAKEQPAAEFAPNAYVGPAPSQGPMQYMTPETHWYDRIFDVLLGEDETAAKNRFALICQSCRLVNGQAPPGTKSLSEVGLWRCAGCGASNGEVDEGKRIIEEVLGNAKDVPGDEHQGESEGEGVEVEAVGSEDVSATGLDGPAGSVKARRRKGRIDVN